MHSTNYANTLILPSEDSKATRAGLPTKVGSVAAVRRDVSKRTAVFADIPISQKLWLGDLS